MIGVPPDPVRDGLGVSVLPDPLTPPGLAAPASAAAPVAGSAASMPSAADLAAQRGGSIALRRAILLAALKWAAASLVLTSVTAGLIIQASGLDICSGTSAYGFALLETWVAVLTGRIFLGATLRLLIWFLWDARRPAETQMHVIVQLIRFEFMLLLCSVLWTTVAFMYSWGSAGTCAGSPLGRYAVALVVLLYCNFALPMLASLAVRAGMACGCRGFCVPASRWLVRWGVLPAERPTPPPQPLPAAAGLASPAAAAARRHAQLAALQQHVQLQALLSSLSETKFRPGVVAPEHSTCSICLERYEDGQPLRLLPCDARHAFHRPCIDTWLREHDTCPVCRVSLLGKLVQAMQQPGRQGSSASEPLSASATAPTAASAAPPPPAVQSLPLPSSSAPSQAPPSSPPPPLAPPLPARESVVVAIPVAVQGMPPLVVPVPATAGQHRSSPVSPTSSTPLMVSTSRWHDDAAALPDLAQPPGIVSAHWLPPAAP